MPPPGYWNQAAFPVYLRSQQQPAVYADGGVALEPPPAAPGDVYGVPTQGGGYPVATDPGGSGYVGDIPQSAVSLGQQPYPSAVTDPSQVTYGTIGGRQAPTGGGGLYLPSGGIPGARQAPTYGGDINIPTAGLPYNGTSDAYGANYDAHVADSSVYSVERQPGQGGQAATNYDWGARTGTATGSPAPQPSSTPLPLPSGSYAGSAPADYSAGSYSGSSTPYNQANSALLRNPAMRAAFAPFAGIINPRRHAFGQLSSAAIGSAIISAAEGAAEQPGVSGGPSPAISGWPGAVPFRPGNWNFETCSYAPATGDTLSGMAATYLGNPNRWQEIWNMQPDQFRWTHTPDGICTAAQKARPGGCQDFVPDKTFLLMPAEACDRAKKMLNDTTVPKAPSTIGQKAPIPVPGEDPNAPTVPGGTAAAAGGTLKTVAIVAGAATVALLGYKYLL